MTRIPELLRHLRLAKAALLWASLVLLLQALIAVAFPWPIKFFIDRVLLRKVEQVNFGPLGPHTPEFALAAIGGVLLTMAILQIVFDRLQETLTTRASEKVATGMRLELLEQMVSRKQAFIDSRSKIDLLACLSGDLSSLEEAIPNALIILVRSFPTLTLTLVLMFAVDTRLSLLLGITMPMMYGITIYYSKQVRVALKAHRLETIGFERESHQALTALPLIKSFRAEPFTIREIAKRAHQMAARNISSSTSQGSLIAALNGCQNILRVIVIGVGGHAVMSGQLSIGGLTIFLSYIEAVRKPIREVAKQSAKHAKAMASIERIETLYVDLKGQQEFGGQVRELKSPATIRFEEVSFSFQNGRKILDHFSATFQPGEFIAVIGASGAGKTTLGKLLNRLNDPVQGKVKLGGTDLKDFDLDFLRAKVTVIHQETFLIRASIRENLELGSTHTLSNSDLNTALYRSALKDFVNHLPEQLETIIGEGGRGVSGGQARRLGLARAFLREQSPVFVFDEATSGVDPEGAQLILESALELKATQNATVFWITHRTDDVPYADKVIFFGSEASPIVGTHESLIAASPAYQQFFSQIKSTHEPVEVNV